MEAILSSETSVYIRSTRRHIPEDGILHSHRRENLKSYTMFENGRQVLPILLNQQRMWILPSIKSLGMLAGAPQFDTNIRPHTSYK
jgi:hypothetical protein